MDNVIVNTLNRVEEKVDRLSTGLATNTAVTDSHTKVLNEIKIVHDSNAVKIINIENQLMRVDSWKNGQTLYQQKTLEDVSNLEKRLAPIEKDFASRTKIKEENDKEISKTKWDGIRHALWIVIGAIIASWKTILDNLHKLLN